jgi:hypothetical protein
MTNVTNFGTGQYTISLPVVPSGSGEVLLLGTAYVSGVGYNIVAVTPTGSAIASLWFMGTNGLRTAMTATAPFTLTTGGSMFFSGSFISAS